MHQSHGVGYAEYARKPDKRMAIERSREEDYRKSQLIYADIERKMQR
ncbi:hypothetical protein [Metabacillus litoralis]|nr:hypothetical protein [Metabacillus litoralis]